MSYRGTATQTHQLDLAYASRDTGLSEQQAKESLHSGAWLQSNNPNWEHRIRQTPDDDPLSDKMPFISESRPIAGDAA